MTILPRADAVAIGGLLIRIGGWLAVPIVLYGLMGVPLGMTMGRYMCSMTAFIVAAMGVVGTGMFLVEHERLAFAPFGDGPADEIADCMPAMVSQTFAILCAIGGLALGLAVATGRTGV